MLRTTFFLLVLMPFTPAQIGIINRADDGVAGEEAGWAVDVGPDLDGDGAGDVLLGAFHADVNGANAGAAYVVSSLTGERIVILRGDSFGDLFGASVAFVGDTDGDGVCDFAVGAPGNDVGGSNSGSVFVFSGSDSSLLRAYHGAAAGDAMGSSVSWAGDVDDDGRHDVAVGIPLDDTGGPDAGQVVVFSSATGMPLVVMTSPKSQGWFGTSVAGLGDVSGDGVEDFIAGAPFWNSATGINDGAVIVFSGAGSQVLWTIVGDDSNDLFGWSVAGLGDVDGDAVPDFLVGAPSAAPGTSVPHFGLARLYSGFTGMPIRTHNGSVGYGGTGRAVCGLGDVTGDGLADYAVGSPAPPPLGPHQGQVDLYSGFDGSLIATIVGNTVDAEEFGGGLAGGTDVNGDGIPEIVIGDRFSDRGGADSGTVEIYGFPPHPGSGEDLDLRCGIGGPAELFPDVFPLRAGDVIELGFLSPNGAYQGGTPVILGQFFLTGAAPSEFGPFPELQLDPFDVIFVLFDGSAPPPPFAASGLPPSGLNFLFTVPGGLAGFSFMLQGFVLDPSPAQANPFFTATNGIELRFL